MLSSAEPVTLRLMTEHDLTMLHEWLNRPHIAEWWGGEAARPTLAEVLEHYRPRVLGREPVIMYIAMQASEPIGFAQPYTAIGCGDGWWEDETDPAPGNHRAIRCYEKAGFVRERVISTPDGQAIYMIQTRQSFERARGAA